jgi:hypothetical protein
MNNLRRLILVAISVFTATILFSTSAHAQWSNELNSQQVSHDLLQEYYYWDDNTLVGTAGVYREDMRWSATDKAPSLTPEGDFIRMARPDIDHSNTCNQLPTRQSDDNHLEIRTNPDGSAVFDVTGDGSSSGWSQDEDGKMKWGEHSGSAWSLGGHLTNGRECEWGIYEGFHKNLTPYASGYLQKGMPYAGKILGEKDMPFEEWVDRSDRRNMYDAYKVSAGNNILSHCNTRPDKDACINDLTASFDRCYATNVGSGAERVDTANIRSQDWTKDFSPDAFVECMKSDQATDKYFDGDKEDFIRKILEDADIPASIKPPLTPKAEDTANTDEKTACAIDRIGWIMCPTLNFVAKITDNLFGILKHWLVVQPFSADAVTNRTSTAYQAWIAMRNIANVIFVICFMVLIFTYLTNVALTKYSMAKLLPRLIVTAVLVNASFIICSLAVDVSNVIGDSLFKIVKDMPNEITSGQASYSNWEWITTSVVLAGGAAAGLVATIASLSALIPIMLVALLSLVVTLIILLLRQALVIILVVIAPIAFGLYLLPNTQKWFDRWKSLFMNMLLLYPAIALVFAGSFLASQIIMRTAQESGEILLAIFALGIQVIPLFIAPIVMKLGGGLLNRFGGIVNNPNKGPFDRLKKRAEAYRDDRKNLQKTRAANGAGGAFGIYGGLQRRNARREAKVNYHKEDEKRSLAKMYGSSRQTMFGNEKDIADSIAKASGGRGNEALKEAIKNKLEEQARTLRESDLKAAAALVDHQIIQNNGDDLLSKLKDRAVSGKDENGKELSETQRAAAIQKVVENGKLDEIHALINNANSFSDSQREVLADTLASSNIGKSAAHLSTASAIEGIRNGSATVDSLYKDAASQGAYTSAAMAQQSTAAIEGMIAAKHSGALSDADVAAIKSQFAVAAGNEKLNQHITSAARNKVGEL